MAQQAAQTRSSWQNVHDVVVNAIHCVNCLCAIGTRRKQVQAGQEISSDSKLSVLPPSVPAVHTRRSASLVLPLDALLCGRAIGNGGRSCVQSPSLDLIRSVRPWPFMASPGLSQASEARREGPACGRGPQREAHPVGNTGITFEAAK